MKLIKLLLIAIVFIGGIYGIMHLPSTDGDDVKAPDYKSAQANEWKQKIDDLCKEGGNWSDDGYKEIVGGIHSDMEISKGSLVTEDEERSLNVYLFAFSCSYVKNGTDKLFKQKSYPDSEIKHYKEAIDFLAEKGKETGRSGNSNLAEASKLMSSYQQIISALSFSSTATYTRPLKKWNGDSADARRKRIIGMQYYKSHFSNNTSIASRLSKLEAEAKRAERDYYENLEECIEKEYPQRSPLEELLEDQMNFDEISTNQSAKDKLNGFITNN